MISIVIVAITCPRCGKTNVSKNGKTSKGTHDVQAIDRKNLTLRTRIKRLCRKKSEPKDLALNIKKNTVKLYQNNIFLSVFIIIYS